MNRFNILSAYEKIKMHMHIQQIDLITCLSMGCTDAHAYLVTRFDSLSVYERYGYMRILRIAELITCQYRRKVQMHMHIQQTDLITCHICGFY